MSKRIGANRKRIKAAGSVRRKKHTPGPGVKAISRLVRNGVLTAVVVAAAVLGAKKVSRALGHNESINMEAVRFSGMDVIDTSEILCAAQIASGVEMTGVNKKMIAERLMKIPYIGSVSIRRGLTGAVNIILKERKPVAMVNLGRIYLTDESGKLFFLRPGQSYELPLVSGLSDSVPLDGPRCLKTESIVTLLSLLDAASLSRYRDKISQGHFNPDGSVTIKLEGYDTYIEMNQNDFAGRFEHLRLLMDMRRRHGQRDAFRIDLRYKNCAFVREHAQTGESVAGTLM
jgi:cell division protein FtsQ